jgi:hypothetical protein
MDMPLVAPRAQTPRPWATAQHARHSARPQQSSDTPAPAPVAEDAVELTEGGNLRTYTAKLLIEKTFGKIQEGAPQKPRAEAKALPDLRAGDRMTVGEAEAMSLRVVRASLERITFTAEVDGATLEIEATRVSVDVLQVDAVTTQQQDPLVLDLAGDGVNLRPLADGVRFDIDGDGQAEQTGFVQGDDALLVWDRDSDGRITGTDLMGDQHGARNGFEELRRYDGNADGQITAADAVWAKLRAYQELNGDGVAQAGELRGLDEAGVVAIGLGYHTIDEASAGQRLTEAGAFVRADGTSGRAVDALLKYREVAR